MIVILPNPITGSAFLFLKFYLTKKLKSGRYCIIMDNLMTLLDDDRDKIRFELSGQDLLKFSNDLIIRTKEELFLKMAIEKKEEKYFTKAEVKQFCGVCDATLWHWQKRNYLNPIRIGRRVMYKKSDIDRMLNGNTEKNQ
jgi:predicted DNA-binding transcriptional regulator AlpA